MKRTMALVLAFVLLMGVVAVAEDMEPVDFEPTLASIPDYTAKEWVSTSMNRALLTWLLTVDVFSDGKFDGDMLSSFLLNTSYVGRKGRLLVVGGRMGDNCLVIMYTPVVNTASYNILEGAGSDDLTDELVKRTMESFCEDGMYKNDGSDMLSIASQLGAFTD